MTYERVSAAEIDYIGWALGEQGHTCVAVAEHLDRDVSTIREHARKLGIKPRHGLPCHLTKAQRDEIVSVARDIGYSGAARIFRLDHATVRYHVRRAGGASPYCRPGPLS